MDEVAVAIPTELSPDALSPDALSPDALSPDALSSDDADTRETGREAFSVVATLEQEPAAPPPTSPIDRLRDALGTLRLRSLSAPKWLPWSRPILPLSRRQRRGRRLLIGGLSTVLVIAVLATQLNGPFGAWLADELRALLGPQATAQIESWYLGVQDRIHQAQYQVSGQPPAAPWSGPDSSGDDLVRLKLPKAMPLPAITPLIRPALPGEGVWTTDGLPPPGPGQPLIVAKTFLRPDPARPYAIVTLLQFDMRYLSLRIVAGKTEPGGPLGHNGPGAIPAADQQGDALFAAFNGGFKYSDGHYGLMANGVVYVPPQPNAATIAITAKGQITLGAWGRDPGLTASNASLVAWRQNASLMIDHGQLNPLTNDGAAWGGVYLNKAYTWRSGLGTTDHGTLLYGAGDSLSAATLGQAMRAAGAYMAMQTDINPVWVRAFLYQRSADGQLQIAKLHPGMQGTGKEYLQGTERDFFYITRVQPPASSPGPPAQNPSPPRHSPGASGPDSSPGTP